MRSQYHYNRLSFTILPKIQGRLDECQSEALLNELFGKGAEMANEGEDIFQRRRK